MSNRLMVLMAFLLQRISRSVHRLAGDLCVEVIRIVVPEIRVLSPAVSSTRPWRHPSPNSAPCSFRVLVSFVPVLSTSPGAVKGGPAIMSSQVNPPTILTGAPVLQRSYATDAARSPVSSALCPIFRQGEVCVCFTPNCVSESAFLNSFHDSILSFASAASIWLFVPKISFTIDEYCTRLVETRCSSFSIHRSPC